MSSYISRGSTRSDIMDDDGNDKDDTKRRSRNLSEKKRRDQFNMLINELSSMVSTNSRKMDKSTVLKSTIAFLKNHNEIAVRSRAHEIQEDWKPSFLSNEEFTHLILEALDGFIIVFSLSGHIIYISESITSLLGHLPSDLLNSSIYDLVSEEDYKEIFNVLHHPVVNIQYNADKENKVSFVCHCKRNDIDSKDGQMYEPVQFIGYFRSKAQDSTSADSGGSEKMYEFSNESDSRYLSSPDESNDSKRLIFVGTGRLETPQLIREMSVVDSAKSEFTSRHSLEWKFLFLDHRAPPIIGYLPFEVLGTSGYDYYHVDDLDKVVQCHEALMQKGEGTSCFYRFLTKGQQWIWLQTRFYITYHQWTSKPEFIVCTHQVVSYLNVMKQIRRQAGVADDSSSNGERSASTSTSVYRKSSSTSRSNSRYLSKCSKAKSSHYESRLANKSQFYTPGDSSNSTTSLSTDSSSLVSRHHAPRQRTSNSSSHSSQQIPQSRSLGPKPQPAMTFYEMPPAVYNLAAVPPYPIQGTVSPSVPPELLRTTQPLVMTSNQSEIQDQLQRKHEELQQLIVQQQEELRKIHEQLIMAKCGFLPPVGNNPALCGTGSESAVAVEMQPNAYAARPTMMLNIHQPNVQAQSSEELIPYQMSQQQAQLLLSSNMTSPNS